MASGSETISIGVAIQESLIRAVVLEVGESTSAVKRYASMPHGGSDIARSVARIADALDSTKTLPVGVASGRLSQAAQQDVVSAVAPSRRIVLFRREIAIAQLSLAPGTKLDAVDDLPGCAVPSRLFEVHPDLRFRDLLDPIGAALAIADESAAGVVPGNPQSRADLAASTPGTGQAPPQEPAAITRPRAPAPAAASAPSKPPTSPVASRAAETRPIDPAHREPTRIRLLKSDLTVQRPRTPAVGSAAHPAAPASTELDPHAADLTVGAARGPRPAPARKANTGAINDSPAASIRIALNEPEPEQPDWRDESERTFGIPVVQLAVDESADLATAGRRKRRRLRGRRPLPLALAALAVLLGVGIALGLFLGGGGSLADQEATGLLVELLAT